MSTADSIEETLGTLFARYPMLAGFTVQDRATLTRDREMGPLDAELSIADLAIDGWSDLGEANALCDDITNAVQEILESHPEAGRLLRGATFARTFH